MFIHYLGIINHDPVLSELWSALQHLWKSASRA